jgi:hypothetical protein
MSVARLPYSPTDVFLVLLHAYNELASLTSLSPQSPSLPRVQTALTHPAVSAIRIRVKR